MTDDEYRRHQLINFIAIILSVISLIISVLQMFGVIAV